MLGARPRGDHCRQVPRRGFRTGSGRAVGGSERGQTRRHWLLAFGSPLAVLLLLTGVSVPASASPRTLPVGDFSTSISNLLFHPGSVAGANDWRCRPSAAHPYPVILLHETAFDMGFDWAELSPMLANAGYCVYALNYGQTALSLGDRFDGLGDIPSAAHQLAEFVQRVRFATRTPRVDIVGHSQGGMMPNYYLEIPRGGTVCPQAGGPSPQQPRNHV